MLLAKVLQLAALVGFPVGGFLVGVDVSAGGLVLGVSVAALLVGEALDPV